MKTTTLHEKPVSGLSTQTVFCSCNNERGTVMLTVLDSRNVRCPQCSTILTFCEHCGEFTSSRQGNENTFVEFGSTHTWDCVGCGQPKSGG